ncbi:MAG: efflux RND transporter periplasmic adaptor subunit [Verrucomicrobia bacterium]|nr:efflux RND transporter periplasmic adaptor subunit [Verrucomicrobiota bacterium]
MPLYIDEIGNTSASEIVNVQAQVAGQIVEVHFQDGAEVKQGDVLFSIDPRTYQAALDKANATLGQNQAKLAYQQAQMKRMDSLAEKKVASSQDFDQSRAQLAELQALVRADEANVQTAKLNLEFCTVRAPISGRAGKRLVDRGNLVNFPGGATLVTIARQDPLFVDFTIAEEKLPAVRAYQNRGTLSVEVWSAAEPTKRRKGEFAFLDNAVTVGNGTVRLRGRVQNEDRAFWPGQFVNVRLVLDVAKGAVLVPSQAVQVGQIGTFVFVIGGEKKVAIRPVRPGQRHGGDVVIEDGIRQGETVVVTGHLFLSPGATVKVTETVPPPSVVAGPEGETKRGEG